MMNMYANGTHLIAPKYNHTYIYGQLIHNEGSLTV